MVKKSKSSFRGKVGANAQKTAKSGSSYGHLMLPKGVPVLNPEPECTIKMDFMPYVVTDLKHPDRDANTGTAMEGTLWYRRPYKLHRNIGANNDSEVCLTSIGKKCPVCEYRAKRAKAGADTKELKDLGASQRNIYVVIPKGHKKFEEKPHIFDMSDYLFQELLTKELKSNEEFEIFPDLAEGLSLKVRFEPGTFKTAKPYPQADRIDFFEREEPYDEAIMETIPNLDEVLNILSYEELHNKFLDESGEESTFKPVTKDEDAEEDEVPVRKKSAIAKIEEPEEDEVPVRKVATKRPVIVDDDDEEIPVATKKPLKRPAAVVEDDDDAPVAKPVKKSGVGIQKVCPHKLRFGVDTELYDVCDTCEVWRACVDEKDKK